MSIGVIQIDEFGDQIDGFGKRRGLSRIGSVTDDLGTAVRDEPTVEGRASRWALALTRISLGVLWFYGAGWKRPPDFGQETGRGLYRFTSFAVEHPVFPPWSWIVEQVVLPNFRLFGWGVLIIEATLGAFLLIGLFTRFWALVGAGHSLTIFLSVAVAPPEWPWSYVLMVMAHLAVAATAAGRTAGLDRYLRPVWAARTGRAARLLERLS